MSEVPCGTCGDPRATMHFTALEKGRAREAHVCESCVSRLDPVFLMPGLSFPKPGEWEPPAEDWLSDKEKAALVCPHCRHIHPRGWSFCTACGSMRRP